MDAQRAVLAARYRVYLPERRAHGHTPDIEGPLSFGDMADDPSLEMFRSLYAAASPDGPDHWPVVVDTLLAMWRSEPTLSDEDLGRIPAPTLIMVGDDDQMALEHTISVFRAIRHAELAVVPGASHAAPLEKPDLVNGVVLDFLVHDPVPTMAPIRRARAATWLQRDMDTFEDALSSGDARPLQAAAATAALHHIRTAPMNAVTPATTVSA